MKRLKNIVFLILLINKVYGQIFTHPLGGSCASMGEVSVCEEGIWSLQNNPAGLTQITNWGAGIYYENRWMLKETGDKSAGIGMQWDRIGTMGILIHQFGSNAYSESQFGLVYAREFGPHFRMGLRTDYLLFNYGDSYPHRSALCFALGIQTDINESLSLGALLYSPLMTSQLSSNIFYPFSTVVKTGIGYRFCKGFKGYLEFAKDSHQEGLGFHSGLEYQLFDRIQLRAGMKLHPDLFCFGIGYTLRKIHIDVAAQMHPLLGASTQMSIVFISD